MFIHNPRREILMTMLLAAMITTVAIADPRLHQAAAQGDRTLVQVLLDQSVEVDLRDGCGFTALHLAARHNQAEVASLLMAAGADPNAADGGG